MLTNQLKKITIALSVSSIKESVYALSALQCYLSPSRDDPPPILTYDRSEALNLLIRNSAVEVIMELSALEAALAGADDEIVSIDMMAGCSDMVAIQGALENAIQMRVLYYCFLNRDGEVARNYGGCYDRQLAAIKEKAGANTEIPHLRPVRY